MNFVRPTVRIGRSIGPQGLKFLPTLSPDYSDDDDTLPYFIELQDQNGDNSLEVLSIIDEVSKGKKYIMEIGVGLYEKGKSFTPILIENAEKYYFGVDIKDRSEYNSDKSYVLKSSSLNQEYVRNKIKELRIPYFDLIIIDGHHSVNSCINDWKYTYLLKSGGLVCIHDTNSHPGPIALMESISEHEYIKTQPLKNKIDYGIGVCLKL